MHTVVYDGTFKGLLSAIFDVYYYKFTNVNICTAENNLNNVFNPPHWVETSIPNSSRVWKGLEAKLSSEALQQLFRTFLSELPGIENIILQYAQLVFDSTDCMETNFSNHAVLTVTQTAKKVWREKHRMEAFVRFQKTKDNIFYAIIEPDFNVLPLISKHFETRYADQQWMIYDAKRKYGIYYNLESTTEINIEFSDAAQHGKNVSILFDEEEDLYQHLWKQYFKSVNISARKNTKLHIRHMPVRYWKYLTEKKVFPHK